MQSTAEPVSVPPFQRSRSWPSAGGDAAGRAPLRARAPLAIRGATLGIFAAFLPFRSRTLVNRLCYRFLFFFPYSEVKEGGFPFIESPLKPPRTRPLLVALDVCM